MGLEWLGRITVSSANVPRAVFGDYVMSAV